MEEKKATLPIEYQQPVDTSPFHWPDHTKKDENWYKEDKKVNNPKYEEGFCGQGTWDEFFSLIYLALMYFNLMLYMCYVCIIVS